MEGLLRFAHKYDFATIAVKCQDYMQSYLMKGSKELQTILNWLLLGDSLNLDPLVDSCLDTIKRSMTVRCSGSFNSGFSPSCLHLQSDVLTSIKGLVTSGKLSSVLLTKLFVWVLDVHVFIST